MVNLNTSSTVNVNLLTHLEKSRIEYLLTQKMSFNDAKRKALTEILSIFNQDTSKVSNPEFLDISGTSAGDAILLTTSAILQGTHSEAELTELLTNISTDINVKWNGGGGWSEASFSLVEWHSSLDLRNEKTICYTCRGLQKV